MSAPHCMVYGSNIQNLVKERVKPETLIYLDLSTNLDNRIENRWFEKN